MSMPNFLNIFRIVSWPVAGRYDWSNSRLTGGPGFLCYIFLKDPAHSDSVLKIFGLLLRQKAKYRIEFSLSGQMPKVRVNGQWDFEGGGNVRFKQPTVTDLLNWQASSIVLCPVLLELSFMYVVLVVEIFNIYWYVVLCFSAKRCWSKNIASAISVSNAEHKSAT